jgi:shikimate dehydrogenase
LRQRERLGVIGDPIGHSLSPIMHRAALDDAGLEWTYDAHLVPVGSLGAWMRSTGRDMRGFNATIPHKVALLDHVESVDRAARTIGAVNTVVREAGGFRGFNTDPAGFRAALAGLDFDQSGALIVVFGAGGAARSVVYALRPFVSRIVVVNRDVGRARTLEAADASLALDDGDLRPLVREADLLVNATPMGMSHLADASPLPAGTELRPEAVVMDLVYGRVTPFLATALQWGCRCTDGLEMLVQQGAESFRLWTRREPNIEAMRSALESISRAGAVPASGDAGR